MGNILRIVKRDILRLLKMPPALAIALALLILPSAYTWYNVVSFWDPYNNASHLRVCVVNEDEGAQSDLTGELHIGDMIVEKLHDNTQFDWAFADKDTALAELQSGRNYAVFIIPADFTEYLLSLTTGDFTQPEIQYYVNGKAAPIAAKITDTGADTLDESINSAFVATVSDAVADAAEKIIRDAHDSFDTSRSQAATKLSSIVLSVENTQQTLGEVLSAMERTQNEIMGSKDSIECVRASVAAASDTLSFISDLTAQTQDELMGFSATAAPVVSHNIQVVTDISSKVHRITGDIVFASQEARANVASMIAQGQTVVDENKALASYLKNIADSLPDDDSSKVLLNALADDCARRAEDAQQALDTLSDINKNAGDISQAASATGDLIYAALQTVSDNVLAYSDNLFASTIPAISESLGRLSITSASLAAAVSNERLLIEQAALTIDQLASTLSIAQDTIKQTSGLLGDLKQDADIVQSDVVALGESSFLAKLFDEGGLNVSKVADFMGSPTELVTEQLYPLDSYGSAMAPLFMNLTFWIGAFMLLVVMKQEVDAEGIKNLTPTQRYLGRFVLFGIMVVLQAVICCAGVLIIGVEPVNTAALFFAAIIASLTYLSIIYALSVTLQHIGKGICLLLVFMQIPGATGLYPVEMTSSFFQTVYPVFPFTYGINAMREAICGFYGSHYFYAIGVLVLFFASFMVLGVLMHPLMTNVNRMVAKQIKQSSLFNGEDVDLPARPYRFSQLFRMLVNKDEYREEFNRRYERFLRWYPRLIRGAFVLGLLVPIALTVFFALTLTEKVWLLTAWLVWMVAVFVFLIAVESMRERFERQMKLGTMSNENLLELGIYKNDAKHANDEQNKAQCLTGIAQDNGKDVPYE